MYIIYRIHYSKSWQINNPTLNESVPVPEMSTLNIRPEYSSDGIKKVWGKSSSAETPLLVASTTMGYPKKEGELCLKGRLDVRRKSQKYPLRNVLKKIKQVELKISTVFSLAIKKNSALNIIVYRIFLENG
ncbi:hypothetical protein CDAR_448161 [Caerostris darwini]|uniref:Uncharacterized protein n=1 Tax=Caerostris darwini TaxID=1538125 RepID=A0AAV4SHB5_9ARAC|nr:hypothetical protein CDAR_448161 [Caerostris darwini]